MTATGSKSSGGERIMTILGLIGAIGLLGGAALIAFL